ncbi:MAG: ribokinase [Verrucomicrobiota bacterium]
MRILNIGSLNIDHVYQVPHFAQPGESLSTTSYQRFAGGKGLNQSVAAARAGAAVRHTGCVGEDGLWLRKLLEAEGVNAEGVCKVAAPSGHAIIQVDLSGENSIVVYAGANREISMGQIHEAIFAMSPGDLLLLTNESANRETCLRTGREHGLQILYNPSPITPDMSGLPLDLVDLLICNRNEGSEITGRDEADAILEALARKLPETEVVLTLGSEGCRYQGKGEAFALPARPVSPVDTTGAGDTFLGYLAAGLAESLSRRDALELATAAAAVAVTRPGAASAIPKRVEVRV